MAAQAALIADTIVGMKRALRRETHDSAPDDSITQPTNRGNKLRTNARFVREGALGYIHPEDFYKQRVEHAGYTRYTLQHNPPRYDSEGDELDEDDEDSEADAAAAEENPFSDITLENLLCPLKHPSDLPTHPSMSHPYTSKALWAMTQAIEAKLHQERAMLWRARNLHRQFLGDRNWIPCGTVETPADRWIFEPKIPDPGPSLSVDKGDGGDQATSVATPDMQKDGTQGRQPNQTAQDDVAMAEGQNNEGEAEGNQNDGGTKALKSEDGDATMDEVLPHPIKDPEAQTNGDIPGNLLNDQNRGTVETGGVHGALLEKLDAQGGAADDKKRADTDRGGEAQDGGNEKDAEMQDASPPESPRRMTTRAQANAENPQGEDEAANHSPSLSGDESSTLPAPHPLFLVPDAVRPDHNFGLPPNEAEETRRLLWSYVQKQEETVRGFEHMLDSLLRACRMKDDVFEWCKAEGHLGEMSDGEDWYDREKWGLAEGEELKKGADEDEIETVDETRAPGKRGRGRRA